MSTRTQAARQYLLNLVVAYETLEDERQTLLQAAARIAEIQTEKAEVIADAQEALVKYNALAGTSYTLTEARKLLSAKVSAVPVVPPVEPPPP
jgi:hypothetical protein